MKIAGLNPRTALLATAFLLASPIARAASHDVSTVTATELAQMEDRAEHADHREQCFLYTELVDLYSQMAASQIAQGQAEAAAQTLARVSSFAEHIHLGLARDSRKLKNAEMMLHTASFHLSQFVRRASDEEKPAFQATLAKLDHVHQEMLAQVFAH